MALRLAGERYPSEGVFDTVTITDGAGHYLEVPKLTTAQRDTLSPTNGMIIYNTTTGRFEGYDDGWDALGIANILTTKGDLFIRGASEIERLAIGAKRFFPRVNESGDGLEYAKGYEFGKSVRRWQWEMDFYEWTTTVTGSASVFAKRYGEISLQTGATAGSTARGVGYRFVWFNYGVDFEWYCRFVVRERSTNGQAWVKIDVDASGDPTGKAIGWRFDDLAAKGIVHDGSSLTIVDLNTALVANITYELFIKFIAGDKVEWYVNGVLKGSSQNIPSGYREAYCFPMLNVQNNADASNNRSELWLHGWIQDF